MGTNEYFICYKFSNPDGTGLGGGRTSVVVHGKIQDLNDIAILEKQIAITQFNGSKIVIVTNWKRFKKNIFKAIFKKLKRYKSCILKGLQIR